MQLVTSRVPNLSTPSSCSPLTTTTTHAGTHTAVSCDASHSTHSLTHSHEEQAHEQALVGSDVTLNLQGVLRLSNQQASQEGTQCQRQACTVWHSTAASSLAAWQQHARTRSSAKGPAQQAKSRSRTSSNVQDTSGLVGTDNQLQGAGRDRRVGVQ